MYFINILIKKTQKMNNFLNINNYCYFIRLYRDSKYVGIFILVKNILYRGKQDKFVSLTAKVQF